MTAPQKEPGGLTKVLFTRVSPAMHDALTEMLEAERASGLHEPDMAMSDLVRMILWETLETRREVLSRPPVKKRRFI